MSKEEAKQNKREGRQRSEKGRHKTVVQGLVSPSNFKLEVDLQQQERQVKKCKSYERMQEISKTNMEPLRMTKLGVDIRNTDSGVYAPSYQNVKNQESSGKTNELMVNYRELEKKVKERDVRIL